jgi:hypothetical protein
VAKSKKQSFNVSITHNGTTQHRYVLVDSSFPKFLEALADLEANEQEAILDTIDKIQRMTWDDVYKTSSKTPGQKRGINYEPIDQQTASGRRIATIRASARIRIRVCREEQFKRLISIHVDHDSAYKEKGGEDI